MLFLWGANISPYIHQWIRPSQNRIDHFLWTIWCLEIPRWKVTINYGIFIIIVFFFEIPMMFMVYWLFIYIYIVSILWYYIYDVYCMKYWDGFIVGMVNIYNILTVKASQYLIIISLFIRFELFQIGEQWYGGFQKWGVPPNHPF